MKWRTANKRTRCGWRPHRAANWIPAGWFTALTVTLEVTQVIHNDLKPFGATINNATQTLWFGNTVNSAVTAMDAKTGAVKGRLVLDARKRSEDVRPLQPRELAADDATNTVYISGIGKESVIWVVDGDAIKLKDTIQNTGKISTALAVDSKAKRLYTANADGEFITIDTTTNKIISRKNCWMMGRAFLYQPEHGHSGQPCICHRL